MKKRSISPFPSSLQINSLISLKRNKKNESLFAYAKLENHPLASFATDNVTAETVPDIHLSNPRQAFLRLSTSICSDKSALMWIIVRRGPDERIVY